MATVVIPSLLRKFTGGVERMTVAGATVREIVKILAAEYPELVNNLVEDGERFRMRQISREEDDPV